MWGDFTSPVLKIPSYFFGFEVIGFLGFFGFI